MPDMTIPKAIKIGLFTLEEWQALARHDDCFNHMVPSDLRVILGHIEADADKLKKMQWQPIETAPKDGTRILGFTPYGIEMIKFSDRTEDYPYYWSAEGWVGVEQDSGCFPATIRNKSATSQPTRWMPLPLSPEGKSDE